MDRRAQRVYTQAAYDEPVKTRLRVVFSKAEGGEPHYKEVSRGRWVMGEEPVLEGEAIPPEVVKGIERQVQMACVEDQGTIRYARADTLYAMDFDVEKGD
jgi:hypothetical protein